VSIYRTPPERFEGLPDFAYAPHHLDQDGLRMHYVDEGLGDPVLCLHGEPTWSFLYRKMIPGLAAVARVVAPDYLGFGRSDKPTDIGWYTFDRHCASIERLVEELDLQRLTLVMQDWGGPIGLRLAVEQPERVARLVILTTGVEGGRPIPRGTVRALADDVAAAYDAPFPTPESKAGALAFAELVPTEPEHPNTAPLLAIREALRTWDRPALVLFGDSDPIFAPEVAHAISRLIPGALPAEIVSNAGHYVQEDAGEELAVRIVEFLTS
jgi:haloalkane dehalogenase